MTLYERLRKLRMEAGMTQDDLAHAMGYKDRSMITKIESGKVDISQKKVIEFARVLNTTPGYLMGWVDMVDQRETERSAEEKSSAPKTLEARIISGGIDKMSKERRERALKILQAAFEEFSDTIIDEGEDEP